MKKRNILLSMIIAVNAPVLSALALHDSIVESDCLPVANWINTTLGTLSIRGRFAPADYGIAIQSWCLQNQSFSGLVAVAAKGGIAKNVAKAIAAQVPGELEHRLKHRRDVSTRASKALDTIIAKLNEAYTTPFTNIGVSDPNELDVTHLAVLLVCTSESSKVVFGSKQNLLGEANVVPKPVWVSH